MWFFFFLYFYCFIIIFFYSFIIIFFTFFFIYSINPINPITGCTAFYKGGGGNGGARKYLEPKKRYFNHCQILLVYLQGRQLYYCVCVLGGGGGH